MAEVEHLEAARRRQLITESKRASEQGLTIGEYRKAHDAKVANLIAIIRAEMDRHGIDDPVEVLPAVLVNIEENAIAKARTAARDAARAEVRAMVPFAAATMACVVYPSLVVREEFGSN
jgi:hypothetical protein